MRWFLLIAFACAVLVTCGRAMVEEEVPPNPATASDSVSAAAPTVEFQRGGGVGAQDSMRVDIRLMSTR